MPEKQKVLFIASNIPTPKRKSNGVILTIAQKLSAYYNISILHPAEIVPFPFSLMKKYKNIANNSSWNDKGIDIYPFKYLRLPGLLLSFLLLPFYKFKIKSFCHKTEMPQMCHAHYILPDGYFAFLLKKTCNIPYVLSIRGTDLKFINLSKNSVIHHEVMDVISNAQKIIVHNKAQMDVLAKLNVQGTLITHGIESKMLEHKDKLLAKDTINITAIGEFITQKHLSWVINAVKEYHGSKKIVLKIAGQGEIEQQLKKLAGDCTNIKFLGQIRKEEVEVLLHDSDIFALPSVNETFGLVYLEAAAKENALIATKNTGVWGVYKENEEAFYCDSEQSFKDMLTALINDDSLRISLSKNAYKRTEEQYTWDIIIGKYLNLYNDVINKQ